MSAPAEKLVPAPTSTTARIASFVAIFFSARVSASTISGSKALCTSGRLSMTVALPCSSTRVTIFFWGIVCADRGWGSAILHAEHAEFRILRRSARRDFETERERLARARRVDDAVVPQTGGGVVRARLAFVL